MRTIPFCTGLILLMTASCSMAQIAECIDANGKKTYAQTCPDEADKKRDIAVPKAPPKTDDSSWKKKEAEFEKRRQERLKTQDRDADQQQHADQQVQECAEARRRLQILESGKPKTRVDPTTGEHVSPDSDQRQGELDELHNTIQQNCR